jgi:hypothetical protein
MERCRETRSPYFWRSPGDIGNSAEYSFALILIANNAGRVWKGLNDAAMEGTFVFVSGAPF